MFTEPLVSNEKSPSPTFSGSRRCSESVTVRQTVSARQLLVDQISHTHLARMMLVPSRDCQTEERCIGCGIDCIRNEANQAAFPAFFFAFGSGATVAFMFALEVPFNAAHRLICACRMCSRPSSLTLRRFLAF